MRLRTGRKRKKNNNVLGNLINKATNVINFEKNLYLCCIITFFRFN